MFYVLLVFLIVQRLGELFLAKRNERAVRAEGAYEVGGNHYKWIVLLHTGWFVSMLAEYLAVQPAPGPLWPLWLGIFVLMQIVRYTVIATLGTYWNTRILIVPGRPPVRRGLYRFINHPNYWVVRVELLVVPLIFELYATAVLFSILNYFMLRRRIRIEDEALGRVAP